MYVKRCPRCGAKNLSVLVKDFSEKCEVCGQEIAAIEHTERPDESVGGKKKK